MSEIAWYLSFSDCLSSLSMMFSKSFHIVTEGKIFSFLGPSSIPLVTQYLNETPEAFILSFKGYAPRTLTNASYPS